MFGMSYDKIQKYHRYHSNHHIEYLDYHEPTKMDWNELIIDWECSQYTKVACPRSAREEMENVISNNVDDTYLIWCLNRYMRPKLNKLGL